ncbi:MAG: four helix bundle protein [Acidobacteria bacterium]|nr:MAG: four helix bundle protein [Acidobacteriota bacterium]
MPITSSFRDLKVWPQSMLLVEDIYRVSRGFPADERFGLTSQIRRSSVSIPSNIGEGGRRKRRKAHLNHLDIALGSQGEVDVQLEIACRLSYVPASDYKRIARRVDEIGRMLNGLIESLQPTDDDWS